MENSAAETEVVLVDDLTDTVPEVPIQLRHPSRVFPRVSRSAIARLVIVPPGPSHTSGSYPLKRARNQVKPAVSPAHEPLKRVKAAAPRQKPGKPVKAATSPVQKKAANKFLEKPQPLPKPTSAQQNAKAGALAKQAAPVPEIKTLQKHKRKHEESDEEEEEEEEEEWEEADNDSEDNSEDDDTWEPDKNPPKPKRFQNNIAENKRKPSPQSKIHASSKTEKAGEDTHPCPECGIVFYQKATLTKHLTIHKQQKLLTPGKQEEAFSNAKTHQLSKPALQENKFVPTTGKKPNPCTECEKSFNCPLMLQKHLTVHEQERKEKTARAQKAKEKADKIERTNEKSDKPNKIPIKNEKTNVNNERKNLNEKINLKANEKIEKTKPKTEETKGNAKAKNHKPTEKPEKIKEKNKVLAEKTETIATKEKNETFRTEKMEKSNEKYGKNKVDTDECTQDTFHVKNAEKVSARCQI